MIDNETPTNSEYSTINWVDRLNEENKKLKSELEAAKELHNMQLAAISTASIQNTSETIADRINKDSPYWSWSYRDTCVAVDREMRERARAEAAEAACAEMREFIEYASGKYSLMLKPRAEHALSSSCGQGWISPEKTKMCAR
jgi:GTPase Era involved in 16S rRNA processing